MRILPGVSVIILGLSLPAAAETVSADCTALTAALRSIGGQTLTAPPAGPEAGWCVLDGAILKGSDPGFPEISVERLRLRGTVADGVPVSVELEAAGLRARPRIGDRTMDDRIRAMLQLQSADLRFVASVDADTETLELREVVLRLSGGTEVMLAADIRGAGLTFASFAGGSLTALDLDWRSDGRLLRLALAMAGERLAEGGTEAEAIDATRAALRAIVEALPEAMVSPESRAALARMVAGLPQGRGRLRLSLTATEGIGASRLLLAGLSDDPTGPDALKRLLADARLEASWQP
ncbi:MAG: hypothetical protein C0524_05855 [Rhodobacter sp.]|nr:hypothetical protein [Rhodobacter sp.]